jgi:hypothetical protein
MSHKKAQKAAFMFCAFCAFLWPINLSAQSLDDQVKPLVASFKGKVSLFAKNLDTGESYRKSWPTVSQRNKKISHAKARRAVITRQRFATLRLCVDLRQVRAYPRSKNLEISRENFGSR